MPSRTGLQYRRGHADAGDGTTPEPGAMGTLKGNGTYFRKSGCAPVGEDPSAGLATGTVLQVGTGEAHFADQIPADRAGQAGSRMNASPRRLASFSSAAGRPGGGDDGIVQNLHESAANSRARPARPGNRSARTATSGPDAGSRRYRRCPIPAISFCPGADL